ncbi:hypothetical protein [Streptomyces sp. col6]|uniref:hypothetical protein n=1 Tax=Streptomyces sp. col6 TaxID=2478958 RepID=UPI0017466652|nr:hypothetical protein [Streptomyces sp. col6]
MNGPGFVAVGVTVVLYQVSHGTITYRQPAEDAPAHHGKHTVYLGKAAARAWRSA